MSHGDDKGNGLEYVLTEDKERDFFCTSCLVCLLTAFARVHRAEMDEPAALLRLSVPERPKATKISDVSDGLGSN
jgi:hypothetical protein